MKYRWIAAGLLTALLAAACSSDEQAPETAGSGGGESSGGKRNSGGSPGTGGDNSGGKATGGTGGSGGSGTGGRENGDVCKQCTRDITAEQSLDCYCDGHSIPGTLGSCATTLSDWRTRSSAAIAGCGYIEFGSTLGRFDVGIVVFDARTKKVVGASRSSDYTNGPCVTPTGNDRAQGGKLMSELCPTAVRCDPRPLSVTLDAGVTDGGSSLDGSVAPRDDGGAIIAPLPSCDSLLDAKDGG